ncbi:MAG: hypothetical protein COS87_02380 [Chloroflexi bacterium CG07_land_8_20_14_0_80_45_17]|nr:MAG: hypothetical protein COS87_02380 [Chloroflexi bacterium CG07_land_8_20_14_0_80_45_17]
MFNNSLVIPREPFACCHSEPFTSCHSEGEKRPKNLAQDKLREESQGLRVAVNFPVEALR